MKIVENMALGSFFLARRYYGLFNLVEQTDAILIAHSRGMFRCQRGDRKNSFFHVLLVPRRQRGGWASSVNTSSPDLARA